MISVAEPQLIGREAEYVADCLRRGRLSGAQYVDLFERGLADACGAQHAAVCCNGTAALHLALLALDLRPGDEVIVPNLTYVATANAVRYSGATPVFCDVDPQTWMLTPETIRPRVTERTRGILVVHLYGLVADIHALDVFAADRGLWIVEDAAEAIGARSHGRAVGSTHLTTLSFYGNKIITCGEGGAVLSQSAALDERIRLYRGQGVRSAGSYRHEVVGYNYRLGELQAAVGFGQLECLDWHLFQHRRVAAAYRTWATARGLEHQVVAPGTEPADWKFTFLVPRWADRDVVAAALLRAEIQTRPAFPLVTSLPMYRTSPYPSGTGWYPVADDISARGLTLPTHAGLTDTEIARICHSVGACCGAERVRV